MDKKQKKELIKEALDINDDKRMREEELDCIADFFDVNYSGGNTLEIGAYKGMTTYLIGGLLSACKERKGKHYVVDLFEVVGDTEWRYEEHPKELLLENTKRFKDIIEVFKGDSTSKEARKYIRDRKYDIVFIDGDHRYPQVLMDLETVREHAKVILTHDYGHPGVTQSIDEFCDKYDYEVVNILPNYGLYEVRKK